MNKSNREIDKLYICVGMSKMDEVSHASNWIIYAPNIDWSHL